MALQTLPWNDAKLLLVLVQKKERFYWKIYVSHIVSHVIGRLTFMGAKPPYW